MLKLEAQYQSVKLSINDSKRCIDCCTKIWIYSSDEVELGSRFLLNFRGTSIEHVYVNEQECGYVLNDPFRMLSHAEEVGSGDSDINEDTIMSSPKDQALPLHPVQYASYSADEVDINFRAALEMAEHGEVEIILPDLIDVNVSGNVNSDSKPCSNIANGSCTEANSLQQVDSFGHYLLVRIEYKLHLDKFDGILNICKSSNAGSADTCWSWDNVRCLYTSPRAIAAGSVSGGGRLLHDFDGVRCWLPCFDSPAQRCVFDITVLNVPAEFDCVCSGTRVTPVTKRGNAREQGESNSNKGNLLNYRYLTSPQTAAFSLGWFIGRVEHYSLPLYQCYGKIWVVGENSATKNHVKSDLQMSGNIKKNKKRRVDNHRCRGSPNGVGNWRLDDSSSDSDSDYEHCSGNEEDNEAVPYSVDPSRNLVYRDMVSHTTLGFDLGVRYLNKFLTKTYNYNSYCQIFVPELISDSISFDGFSLINSRYLHGVDQIYMETPVHLMQISAFLFSWLLTAYPIDSYASEFLIHGAVDYLINIYLEYLYGEEAGKYRFLKMYDTVIHLEKTGRGCPLVSIFPPSYEQLLSPSIEYMFSKACVLYHLVENRVGRREPMRLALKQIVQSPPLDLSATAGPQRMAGGRPHRMRSNSGLHGSAPPTPRNDPSSFPPPTPHGNQGNFPPPTPHGYQGNFPPPTPHGYQGNFPPPTPHGNQGNFPPPTPHGYQGNFPPPTPYSSYSASAAQGESHIAVAFPHSGSVSIVRGDASPSINGLHSHIPTHSFPPASPRELTHTAVIGAPIPHDAWIHQIPLAKNPETTAMPPPAMHIRTPNVGVGGNAPKPSTPRGGYRDREVFNPALAMLQSSYLSKPTVNYVNPNQLLAIILAHGGSSACELNDDFIDRYMFDCESVLFVRSIYKLEGKITDTKSKVLSISMEAVPTSSRTRSCNMNDPSLAKLFAQKEELRFRVVEDRETAGPEGVTEGVVNVGSRKPELYTQHIRVKTKRGPPGKKRETIGGDDNATGENDAGMSKHISSATGAVTPQTNVIKTILFDPLYTRLLDIHCSCPDSLIFEQISSSYALELSILYQIRALRALVVTSSANRLLRTSVSTSTMENLHSRNRKQLQTYIDVIQGTGNVQHDIYVRAEAAHCLAAWQQERAPMHSMELLESGTTTTSVPWEGMHALISILCSLFVDATSGVPVINDLLNEPGIFLCHALLGALSTLQSHSDCLTPLPVAQILVYFLENIGCKKEHINRNFDEDEPGGSFAGGHVGNASVRCNKEFICYDNSHSRAYILVCLSRMKLGSSKNEQVILKSIRSVAYFEFHKDISDARTKFHTGEKQLLMMPADGIVAAAALTCLSQLEVYGILHHDLVIDATSEFYIDYRSLFMHSTVTAGGGGSIDRNKHANPFVASSDASMRTLLIKSAALEAFVLICFARFLHDMKQYYANRMVHANSNSSDDKAKGMHGGQHSHSSLANIHIAHAISTVSKIIASSDHTVAFKRNAATILLNALQDKEPCIAASGLSLGDYSMCNGWSDPGCLTLPDRRKSSGFSHNTGGSATANAGSSGSHATVTTSSVLQEYHRTMLKCRGRAMKSAVKGLWQVMVGDSARYDQPLRCTLLNIWMFAYGSKSPRCHTKEEAAAIQLSNVGVTAAPGFGYGFYDRADEDEKKMLLRDQRFKIPVHADLYEKISKIQRYGSAEYHASTNKSSSTAAAALSLSNSVSSQVQKPSNESQSFSHSKASGGLKLSLSRASLTSNKNSNVTFAEPNQKSMDPGAKTKPIVRMNSASSVTSSNGIDDDSLRIKFTLRDN